MGRWITRVVPFLESLNFAAGIPVIAPILDFLIAHHVANCLFGRIRVLDLSTSGIIVVNYQRPQLSEQPFCQLRFEGRSFCVSPMQILMYIHTCFLLACIKYHTNRPVCRGW